MDLKCQCQCPSVLQHQAEYVGWNRYAHSQRMLLTASCFATMSNIKFYQIWQNSSLWKFTLLMVCVANSVKSTLFDAEEIVGVLFPALLGFAVAILSPPCWNVKWPETPGLKPEEPGPIPEAARADYWFVRWINLLFPNGLEFNRF